MRLKNRGNRELILGIFLALLIFFVFKSWFSFGLITSGDWGFFYFQNLRERLPMPLLWSNDGLGRVSIYHWVTLYFNLLISFLASLRLPWPIIEKFIWPWPFLILTIFSSWYLAKTFFPKNKIIQFFVLFIYLFNTYILMIVGGGQMGIAIAYALAPLVFGIFVKSVQSSQPKTGRPLAEDIKLKTLTGLVLALQVMFGPRISFLTMGAVFLYAVLQYGLAIKKYIRTFVLPFFIALGLHFYWLLPVILIRRSALPAGYGEPGWVEFLSFGNFSDSISLLHPNWPENIFGKTYFMRPEFLMIPILAFSSLLFISQLKTLRAKKNILFFASLGLIGAFLAKGSKPPFGGIYLWLFKYFPGMNMFRDSTKFYLLVALSYSVLIPFSVSKICGFLRKRFNY